MERVVVGVPIDSVGAAGGTELAPEELRLAGVVDAVQASDAGDLDVRIAGTERDPATGIVGYPSVLATVRGVRDGLAPHLAAGRFPVVLGGCCTLIPGAVAAARGSAGQPVGLVTIDGHLDLYDAETSETGEAADLPVALCVGHGDEQLAGVGPSRPLVAGSHVALLAHRDSDEARGLGSLMPDQANIDLSWDDAAVRGRGPTAVATEALERLTARVDRYWLAIDVDVSRRRRLPGYALQAARRSEPQELVELAAPLATDSHCIGLSFACYDPDLDTADRVGARDAREMLERLLAG